MKLIKLTNDHYIIVDDSKINNGDVHFDFDKNEIDIWEGNLYSNRFKCKKITHSTQPLEEGTTIHDIEHKRWVHVKYIDLSEVKELIGEVDVFTVVEQWSKSKEKFVYQYWNKPSFVEGYNQALEDNKDRKWTDEDLIKACHLYSMGRNLDSIMQSIKQQATEWEVEIVEGKITLKKHTQ